MTPHKIGSELGCSWSAIKT